MADEINLTFGLSATKGSLTLSKSLSDTANLTTATYSAGAQVIGTTQEAISIGGDVSGNGWAFFQNTDATNYVEIGVVVSATFYPVVKLLAGEGAQFRVGGTVLYAKANTANCILDYAVFSA